MKNHSNDTNYVNNRFISLKLQCKDSMILISRQTELGYIKKRSSKKLVEFSLLFFASDLHANSFKFK
jgi:hypothetical protein